ncbi:hypothetical protein [Bacillus sp. Marseille-Q3570]|uniref:hypothetical protein n=1 Tax=Bacillus sp. Marseille-Q3570 TaxID=2963522 RepID=UPI0021B76708|nr:hypothetical protein [Bacillus sp. Marseille-Q3570]
MNKSKIYTLLSISTFGLTLLLIVLYVNGIDPGRDEYFIPLVIIGIITTIYSIPKIDNTIIRKTLFGIVITSFILLFLAMAVFSSLIHKT